MILLLSAFVPMSARLSSRLTRRTPNLFDLTSSCNHKCATSMCLMLPIPCRWRMCCYAFASMINTGFTAKPSHISCSGPPSLLTLTMLLLTVVLLLLLVMIFCFLVHAFKRCRPTSATPAFDDFLVSLSPSQSESNKTVTSELVLGFKNLDPLSLSLQLPNESLRFGEAVL